MLQTLYELTPHIGTSVSSSTWTYAELKGIDNITEALNEVVQQYFFMEDDGFASNHVTGIAPTFTLTGRRILGDDAQEYIFGNKYKLGADRESSFKLTWKDDSGTTKTLTVPCTIANVQEWGGASTDDAAISFEIRFNGAPTIA